jgi:polyhydroxyalkanoate synthesis regulator phasin
MAAPGNAGDENGRTLREHAERLVLAAIGAVALSGERADELADELAEKAGIRRDEAIELIREVTNGWRREAGKLGERTTDAAQRIVREVGLVTREEYEELELRVAQLDHRVRLLERRPE